MECCFSMGHNILFISVLLYVSCNTKYVPTEEPFPHYERGSFTMRKSLYGSVIKPV